MEFYFVSLTMSGLSGMAQEAGMFTVYQTIGNVLCCKCGISMQPNTTNMCLKCLCSEVDITEGLLKLHVIVHCPECQSYLQPPRTWVKLQLETKELLAFCLKRLQKNMNVNKVKLVNAEFIWTEPHSKRVKVKVSVQKEVYNGAILQQSYLVEYVQQDHMCESCSRVQANPDQRTFFYLEQLILKHGAAARAVRIKQMDHGIDFYFSKRSHGNSFLEFIGKVAPIRSRNDKQLVSHDSKSNDYNYKYTFSVEISPICREDLICLPPKAYIALGNIGPIVICTKVTNSIALLDPLTLKYSFLDADQYWRASFKSLLTSKELVEYIVLDLEVVSSKIGPSEITMGGTKYVLADAQVARPGDHALGYDLYRANSNDTEYENYKGHIPEVILIKKSYKEKRCGKPRSWKSLPMEVDDKVGVDYNLERDLFLKDPELEELMAGFESLDLFEDEDEEDNMEE
ncbi:hypothetical protein MtrunA17_Chr4g0059211 [Medicago truncatula]|uniref:60S ribosomal export protein NMD3 n=1 Tax=Medicago truncatula TaxID=3880 RepID=A0A396ID67_MEDTR|nr:hypothetical protein MtrunA17_Chr4g0059211 [Medicago truncatula]